VEKQSESVAAESAKEQSVSVGVSVEKQCEKEKQSAPAESVEKQSQKVCEGTVCEYMRKIKSRKKTSAKSKKNLHAFE
jgi:hypothetical protein